MNGIEQKAVSFEIKELDADGTVVGYGAVYGNIDRGADLIEPQAFDSWLTKRAAAQVAAPKMLWQHDPSKPIGVWHEITSDSRGLLMKGKVVSETVLGREAVALMKAGAVDGLSIGYRTTDSDFEKRNSGTIRLIKGADLWETSIVTFPMNPEARVTDVKQLSTVRDVERILSDAGVPNAFAKLVAGHGFDEAQRRIERKQREAATEDDAGLSALMTELKKLKEALNA